MRPKESLKLAVLYGIVICAIAFVIYCAVSNG